MQPISCISANSIRKQDTLWKTNFSFKSIAEIEQCLGISCLQNAFA